MSELKPHKIVLESYVLSKKIRLRPLTEQDWDVLFLWNNDPEILCDYYYHEAEEVTSLLLEDIQTIYRMVSEEGFCFIIEVDGTPIGECSLGRSFPEIITEKYETANSYRIDLMIGEKSYWGMGIGTEVIRLLTEFAFLRENADFVFGCHIANYNTRSLKAFQKTGYAIIEKSETPDSKSTYRYYVSLRKEKFLQENSFPGKGS